jgi:hypothetical protein
VAFFIVVVSVFTFVATVGVVTNSIVSIIVSAFLASIFFLFLDEKERSKEKIKGKQSCPALLNQHLSAPLRNSALLCS